MEIFDTFNFADVFDGDTGGGISDLISSSNGGDGFDFIDSSIFDGDTLGDTVGTAGKLLSLLKAGTGAASGVFGGGGSGESKGFVPQTNPQLTSAKDFQVRQALQQATLRERSKEGIKGNNHSRVIINQLFKDNESGIRAFGSQLAAVAAKSGTRSQLRSRATA